MREDTRQIINDLFQQVIQPTHEAFKNGNCELYLACSAYLVHQYECHYPPFAEPDLMAVYELFFRQLPYNRDRDGNKGLFKNPQALESEIEKRGFQDFTYHSQTKTSKTRGTL